MDTLSQIQTKLRNVMLTSNIESPELDALCLLLSNSIYINQANVTSAAIEMSPSKCIQLNSAITHARDKGYSVFRGRNPHFLVRNAYVTKIHDMSKYAIFAETNNYKLVLAHDYSNYNRLNGTTTLTLEVILTKDVLTESFTAEGLYSHRLSGTGISEDISLFSSNGKDTSEWKEINLVRSIEDIGLLDISDDYNDSKKVAIITDTDYSANLYNVTKFKSDYAYICKYLPLITNDIGDTIELMSKFKSFNGFALKNPEGKTGLDYVYVDDTGSSNGSNDEKANYVSPKETNKDNIYLNSIYAFNTIHKISTENDIEYLFKSYKNFAQRTEGVKCIFKTISPDVTEAYLYYVPSDLDTSTNTYRKLSDNEKSDFIINIKKSHYLEDSLRFPYQNIKEVEAKPINEITGYQDSASSYRPANRIYGHIAVHGRKDVLNEVIRVANQYVKSHYNTSNNKFCPAQWLAEMQNVDGVNYIEFMQPVPVIPLYDYTELGKVLSNKTYNSDRIGSYIEDYIIKEVASDFIGFTAGLIEEG